ncbi:PREDICTED: sulfotransferase family cytosolic 1B member 1-like [Vollenhovia emeryi]|uniref:sulfotransferase family cytosolic 1B member 1-like n=1 Tax=Vollenhovia emeryi TaxID=411798 RepID=UPI0005F36DFD|nr:PREDICTED: sulfotransferase family cytosolic 1B member 1-like [Vollenhovia emeryi]
MSFEDLKVERIKDELAAELLKRYPCHKDGFVKVGQKEWFLPYKYVEKGGKIYNFKIRPDDTWVITHPRSGTTMTQELVWLIANDMNFEEARRRYLRDRVPFIDFEIILDDYLIKGLSEKVNAEKFDEEYSIEFVQSQPSPRFIKSHLPLELLPTVVNSTCKIIYVARNPRDVVVSWYLLENLEWYQGTFAQYCANFINNQTIWSPYWEHIKEAWAMRHRANMMFLFYEDLIKDLPKNIRKIAAFYGKNYSDEQIAKLAEHLKIENFRNNSMVNQPSANAPVKSDIFIRQGKTGGWKSMFTPEIEDKFSTWIADNLKDTDLTFPS